MEKASRALDDKRYVDVCTHLVASGFSETVCTWIVATMEGDKSASLTSKQLETFLRGQKVRNLSGRIVGFYDEAQNEYEVRVGGRLAILQATETSFRTTGGFRMWAQAMEKSEEELASGRVVAVQVYREWPLFQAIRRALSDRGADKAETAGELLSEVVRGWEEDYCQRASWDYEGGCAAPGTPVEQR